MAAVIAAGSGTAFMLHDVRNDVAIILVCCPVFGVFGAMLMRRRVGEAPAVEQKPVRAKWGRALWAVFFCIAATSGGCHGFVCGNMNAFFEFGKSSSAHGGIRMLQSNLDMVRGNARNNRLAELLDAETVRRTVRKYSEETGCTAFQAAVEVYSTCFLELARQGRGILTESQDTGLGTPLRELFDETAIRRAVHYDAAGYLSADDPWDNPYRIYLGPWPAELGPTPFRVYTMPEGDEQLADSGDVLTIHRPKGFAWAERPVPDVIGLPASAEQALFIWSFGSNGRSDQAQYREDQRYDLPATQHYAGRREAQMGGGDDVNNWDPGQSWRRFRSYNH